MTIEFHNTGYGRKFFEAQLPQLIREIGRLADEVQRMNDQTDRILKREEETGVEYTGREGVSTECNLEEQSQS